VFFVRDARIKGEKTGDRRQETEGRREKDEGCEKLRGVKDLGVQGFKGKKRKKREKGNIC